MFLTADQTFFKYGGQLELKMHYKKWIEKWRSYRYRFVPWIALNLRKRLDDPLFVYSFNKPTLSLQCDIHFFACTALSWLSVARAFFRQATCSLTQEFRHKLKRHCWEGNRLCSVEQVDWNAL